MRKFKLKKRKHGRRNSKKQFIVITVCLLVFVFILGTAYSAFSTNLSLNASGSITEHTYTTEDLKNLTVTDGDGLYEDEYEDCTNGRYVYKGGDPDNYIELGSDLFRIIAIECDGTLKVMSDESVGSMVYDPGYSTAISDSILTTTASSITGTRYSSTSTDYCYDSSSTSYHGCNAWGSSETTLDSDGVNVTTMPREVGGTEYTLPDTEAYINMYLNKVYYNSLTNSIKAVVEEHLFNIGNVAYSESQTLETDISQEEAYKWRGTVGLINASDYIQAVTNSYCTGLAAYYSNSSCYNTADSTDNWMYKINGLLALSPYSNSVAGYMYLVSADGDMSASRSLGVYPVLYLSSSITLQGDGTESSPYTIIS